MAENKSIGEMYVDKFTTEAEEGFLYEYKTGEFSSGEVIGMVPLSVQCPKTEYNYKKDTTQEYSEIDSFVSEEGYRETDLQFPLCGNC